MSPFGSALSSAVISYIGNLLLCHRDIEVLEVF